MGIAFALSYGMKAGHCLFVESWVKLWVECRLRAVAYNTGVPCVDVLEVGIAFGLPFVMSLCFCLCVEPWVKLWVERWLRTVVVVSNVADAEVLAGSIA